ncbi:Uncharacterised protein [Comamonas aquatica]|uniref:Uncharacterized protein n=1 Tax=Comamonas aquatica TaxID=225991 RepID=A0AA35GJD6_9BURK|nr:Uncharacterised protein [Comamonas aquatica]
MPLKVGVVSLVMLSELDKPVSLAESKTGVLGAGGAVVSSTYACNRVGPLLPASSTTRTCNVLLPPSVAACDQVLLPTVASALLQLAPLLREISTRSPAARFALSVPEMVCAAVRVMKSVPALPVSAEKLTEAMVVTGAMSSTTVMVKSFA